MTDTPTAEESRCLFVTLGMLVIDQVNFPAQDSEFDVIGGSGAYCCLGARLYMLPPQSRQLGWLLHTGDDFPLKVQQRLQSWDILLLETRATGQLSTRGELTYQDTTFGPKTFRYTTEPLKTEPRHLLDTPLLSSQYFHILTSVNDATDQVRELLKLRNSRGIEELPTIIWEPAPLSCLLENLASCLKAIKLIDVFSPNHIELAALFGIDANRDGQCERATIQELGYKCLLNGIGAFNKGTVVIRAGHEGCCVFSRKQQNFVWLPPYYLKSKKVVDPTGAGNAFLGGFAVGLMETGDDITAACYGMIASTFALEQTGLPVLDSSRSVTADGITTVLETWNGTSVRARLQEYVLRIGLPLETPSIACELAARPSVD